MKAITKNHIEDFTIETLRNMGWGYMHGLAIAPGAELAENENFEHIVLIKNYRNYIKPQGSVIFWDHRASKLLLPIMVR
jgi:hypothetical protein